MSSSGLLGESESQPGAEAGQGRAGRDRSLSHTRVRHVAAGGGSRRWQGSVCSSEVPLQAQPSSLRP